MKNNIKDIRKTQNITQEQLARIIDITLRQMQNIENNKNIPSVLIAIKIKKALNVENIEELFILEKND